MSVHIAHLFVILLLMAALSFGSNIYYSKNRAKQLWQQFRKDRKSEESNTVLVITPDGEEIGRRRYSYSVLCKRGYTIDKILSDGSFTCKRGPGIIRRVKCRYVYGTVYSMRCPGYMYVNSFWTEGTAEKIRCCGDRNLKYSENDCNVYKATNKVDQQVAEDKFWIGFDTKTGGVFWYNKECGYTTAYEY